MDEESPKNIRTNITKEDIPEIAKKLGISSSWCKNDNFLKMVVNMIYAFAMQTRVDPDAGVGISCLDILVGMDDSVVTHLVKLHNHMEEVQNKNRESEKDARSKVRGLEKDLQRAIDDGDRFQRHAESFESITRVLGMVITRDDRLSRALERN